MKAATHYVLRLPLKINTWRERSFFIKPTCQCSCISTRRSWTMNLKCKSRAVLGIGNVQLGFSCWSTQVINHTHTRLTARFSGTTRVNRYQKGKTNLDFTEASKSEWQWQQLGHMQVCTSLQTDNHASTPPLSFLQAWCPSCRPTNSVKALKTQVMNQNMQTC